MTSGRNPARVRLPALQRATLPGGLRVIVAEHRVLPVVAVQLGITRGLAANPPDRAGLADVVAEMIRMGTTSRTADQIAEQMDSMGALLASEAGYDSSGLTAASLAEDLPALLEILSDLVTNPVFPETELAQTRERRLNQLKTRFDDPSAIASEIFTSLLFPGHPYGHPPDGTVASVSAITRADLQEYHRLNYSPGCGILVIVGDLEAGRTIERIREAFGSWAREAGPPPVIGDVEPPKGVRFVLADRPDLTQAQIRLGHLGVARDTPDWFPLRIANYILGGGGFSSRLLDRVRVQKGYTYGLSTSFAARFGRGPYMLSTFTPHETVAAMIRDCLDVTQRFLDEGPGQRELEEAKNFFVSGFPQNFETPGRIASALMEVEMYGLGDDYIESCQDRFSEVSSSDVTRVARDRFDPGNFIGVAVTASEQVREALSGIGPVENLALPEP